MTNGNDSICPVEVAESIMSSGLTKREYFAAMALQGLAVHGGEIAVITKQAVILADALITSLNKT